MALFQLDTFCFGVPVNDGYNQPVNLCVMKIHRRQNTPTLSSEIVQESDFSDTADNSAYVSDEQSDCKKKYCATIFLLKFFDIR